MSVCTDKMVARFRPWPEVPVDSHVPGDWTWLTVAHREPGKTTDLAKRVIVGVRSVSPDGYIFYFLDREQDDCGGYFEGTEDNLTMVIHGQPWNIVGGEWVRT